MMTDQGRFAILNCRSGLGVLEISREATQQRRLAKTARRTRNLTPS